VIWRCPGPGISDGDRAEILRFADFLRDPDPDRGAAYARHYPEVVIVHVAHFHDGYPLCWDQDRDGQFTASRVDADVTCVDCLKILAEP